MRHEVAGYEVFHDIQIPLVVDLLDCTTNDDLVSLGHNTFVLSTGLHVSARASPDACSGYVVGTPRSFPGRGIGVGHFRICSRHGRPAVREAEASEWRTAVVLRSAGTRTASSRS